MHVVGIAQHGFHDALGHEYLLADSDHLVSIGAAHGTAHQSPHSSRSEPAGPVSTLVGSPDGLEINLVWDSSVRTSADWAAIEAAVVAAAEIYTETFSDHIVVNIAVGFGEIDGSRMSASALGESENNGYVTNYSTVAGALDAADSGLISNGLMASDAFSAHGPPTAAPFFVASAEAKALALVSGSSTTIDGYIGIGTSPLVSFATANGGTIANNQYDAVDIAAHEISEVMGRVGLQGERLGRVSDVYTPLDIFRYIATDVRDLTPATGYFSTTDGSSGATNLNTYNNPKNGGDSADWASVVISDSYDAAALPGVAPVVSWTDLLEVASLGYHLNQAGLTDVLYENNISA